MTQELSVILVPQGREYESVKKGIRGSSIQVIPIPMGKTCVNFLENLNLAQESILLMGVAGSLSEQLRVGDVVCYQSCVLLMREQQQLLPELECTSGFSDAIISVKGLTTDTIVCSSKQKKILSQYAEVVDMESYHLLELYQGRSVTILRVISDNIQQNLPNLNSAINSQGEIKKISLALAMLREPQASMNLINSSLKSLKKLESLAREITRSSQFHFHADEL